MSSKTKRKAIRDIKTILKALDHDEQILLIREVAFKLEVEAIAERLMRAIANMDRRQRATWRVRTRK